MADGPLVSVVIPTHSRREALRRALVSLGDQSLAGSSYEVVVAVDGSADGTTEMLAGLETAYELRTVVGPKRGRAGACNAAIAEAGGEVLVILDDDMEAAPRMLESHLEHHPPDSRVCVMGAVPVVLTESSTSAARHVKANFDLHLSRLSDPEHRRLPRSFYTGNASLRAEVMREVGGFDEGFGIYGNEDVELALRLRGVGVSIEFDPEALARQSYDKDLKGLESDTYEKGGTTVMLARRHPEVFADLRLADAGDASRPWLAMRSILLAAARHRGRVREAVFAIAAELERVGFSRRPLFYRAVLDFAFWAGVCAELEKEEASDDLVDLSRELKRGPIGLLLHG